MEEAANKAIAIEEGNAVAHYLLGKARKGQDDDLMTIAHLTKAITLKDCLLYTSEAGRAGRDGEKAYAVILYSLSGKVSTTRLCSVVLSVLVYKITAYAFSPSLPARPASWK